jgi:hypothetical protein
MNKRIVIGGIGGAWDARMARPGYDAEFSNVNDKRQISFAASRPSFGQVAEAGTIAAADTWVPFSQTYSGIPCVIGELRNGGATYHALIRHYLNASTDSTDATAFVLAVEQGQVLATSPTKSFHPYQGGDFFNFFAVK